MLHFDVYVTSVSPPDEHDYCDFGFMLWASADLAEAAAEGIVEVDEDRIVTYGDSHIHVSQHPEGAIVSVPRTYLHYVVTEYGVVDLLGKSQRERAELLISIAHPDFRDELQQAAKALFWPSCGERQ